MLSSYHVLQTDREQDKTVAHAALILVDKLLSSQLDGSDGLDAVHNTGFLVALSHHPAFVNSLLYMCKQGSVGTRLQALKVLQHFLVPRAWKDVCHFWQLVSLGVMPTLFDIATNKSDSTGQMQSLADASLQAFHGSVEKRRCMGGYGRYPLVARLVGTSVTEFKAAQKEQSSR